ncbi:MAG: hypothetical protein ACFFDT_26500 [Candidatus Hodarchaeota archaeon]
MSFIINTGTFYNLSILYYLITPNTSLNLKQITYLYNEKYNTILIE